MVAENSESISACLSRFLRRTTDLTEEDAAESDTVQIVDYMTLLLNKCWFLLQPCAFT